MTEVICEIILLILTLLLFLIFGKNKRQMKKIPKGMFMVYNNPMLRYLIYALGVFMLIFVGGCVMLCYYAGGFQEAGNMMFLCIVLAIANFIICLILGQVLYAACIFVNEERIIVRRAFRPSLEFYWYQLGEMKVTDKSQIQLYDRNGEHCIRASANMINYDKFLLVAKRHLR